MNKFFATGNLTRDPELSETASGTRVCRFAIAVNRPYSDSDGERQTDFFNCTAWRGTAENVAKYCAKGSKVAVVGSIQIRNYEDNHGNQRTSVDVIVQDCEFLSSPKREAEAAQPATPQRTSARKKGNISKYDDDGDIPF